MGALTRDGANGSAHPSEPGRARPPSWFTDSVAEDRTRRVTELTHTLTALHEAETGLSLSPTDLCFLVALRARADHAGLTAFDEDALGDVFHQVLTLVEREVDNPRARATAAIRRLREQRLLTRIDGAGMMRAGEYALTRLADALAEFFLQEETLTRESLALLTHTLMKQLEEILAAARRARGGAEWKAKVAQPLRVTAGDLLGGIERRQRGLDRAQGEVRQKIALLLRDDWFKAIEACEALLEETAATLRELNDILLRDAAGLQTLLQDIAEEARKAGNLEGESAAQQLANQVDRVAAWGASRQRAWSDYYRYVQRFLRDVVRLDPGRALSQRLRDQLRGFCAAPFHLVTAEVSPLPLLRVPDMRQDKPAVMRVGGAQALELEAVLADDPRLTLDARARDLLAQRPPSLAAVVRELVQDVPEAERFRAVGRVTEACGQAPVARRHERAWIPIGSGIAIQDWEFLWRKKRR